MGKRFLQRLGFRQISMGRIIKSIFPGIMPQPQHAAHGHIDLALRQIEIGFAIFQQGHNSRIHLHRRAAGGIVCTVSHSETENIRRDWKANLNSAPDFSRISIASV